MVFGWLGSTPFNIVPLPSRRLPLSQAEPGKTHLGIPYSSSKTASCGTAAVAVGGKAGSLVGGNVGGKVGCEVGAAVVGDKEGSFVGVGFVGRLADVGNKVKGFVGADVGVLVGAEVACTTTVGDADEGGEEGPCDGADDGSHVG